MIALKSITGATALITLMCGAGAVAINAQEKPANPNSALSFKSSWKMSLPVGTSRALVADVMGDNKLRLLTLGEDNNLVVHKVVEGKPEKEASLALGKDGTKCVVGNFVKGKPALIVAPGGTFFWEKDKFIQKKSFNFDETVAAMSLIDGTEAVTSLTRNTRPKMFLVDLSTEDIFKEGDNVPDFQPKGGSLRSVTLDPPRAFFEMMPFPDEVKKGAIARIFDPRKEGSLFGLFSWQAQEDSHIAVLDGGDIFPNPNGDAKPIWKSPKLEGKVLYIALGADIKGSKQVGFYVLLETGAEKKERILEFFALE